MPTKKHAELPEELNAPLEDFKQPQTDQEIQSNPIVAAEESIPIDEKAATSQTGGETVKKPRRSKKADVAAPQTENEVATLKSKRMPSPAKTAISVLAIDDRPTVETEADKAQNDLLDLLESQRTGRILSGTIQGVEHAQDYPNLSFAVIYHGEFKVIIPATEAVDPPEDYRERNPNDVHHYMLTKRLGAEVDYIVKGIDPTSGIAAASRLEAMRARRKEFYFGTDRDGNNLVYAGVCAEARVVSVIRAGIFIDLFGLELYIPLRELSYQRWMDAAAHFQPGQRVLVKVLDVDRRDRNNIKASASVKQAGENPYEKALRKYSVGNRYVGTVSMVDVNGVFVALDGGIDCLCSYPKRGRPPRGARVTVRILGINHETNRIWGAITHITTPR